MRAGRVDGHPHDGAEGRPGVALVDAMLLALSQSFQRRIADDRQIAEEFQPKLVADVVGGAEEALAELLEGGDAGAGHQAEHQG
jgi:hypothetical protein